MYSQVKSAGADGRIRRLVKRGNVLHLYFGFYVLDGQASKGMLAAVAWFSLLIAGMLEVAWAYSMKLSDGFSKPLHTFITLCAMSLSVGLLAWAMRSLPLGTAYPVWTGIGTVGAFVVGVLFLGEPANTLRIVAAVLIVSGLVLMKLSHPA